LRESAGRIAFSLGDEAPLLLRRLLIDALGVLWMIGSIYGFVLILRMSASLDRIAKRLDDLAARVEPKP
jgi:hypothetical protein